MQAASYARTGPAADVIQLGELPTPEPGPGEVRVQLRTSGVNPSDVKRRAGFGGQKVGDTPVIPHSDGAGVIDAVGPGISDQRLDEAVWLFNAQWQRPHGTAAEAITVPADLAVPFPGDADGEPDFAAGACLGIPAMTAHRALFADGSIEGQTVLVTGGAGAVGHYAVQLAKWGGAQVIATISNDDKANRARTAGADHILNYRSDDVAGALLDLTNGEGVDRVVEVDFGENLPTNVRAVKVNGVIAPYASARVPEPTLPYYALMMRGIAIQMVFVYQLDPAARRSAVDDLTTCLRDGVLQHQIGARFPLADTVAAHEAQEQENTIGNIVIDI